MCLPQNEIDNIMTFDISFLLFKTSSEHNSVRTTATLWRKVIMSINQQVDCKTKCYERKFISYYFQVLVDEATKSPFRIINKYYLFLKANSGVLKLLLSQSSFLLGLMGGDLWSIMTCMSPVPTCIGIPMMIHSDTPRMASFCP